MKTRTSERRLKIALSFGVVLLACTGCGDVGPEAQGVAHESESSNVETPSPIQTIWKRHKRFSTDGTWDLIHARLVAGADAAGAVEWSVSVDSTINRAHQHATTLSRVESPTGRRRGLN
jgi:hypothetical protein